MAACLLLSMVQMVSPRHALKQQRREERLREREEQRTLVFHERKTKKVKTYTLVGVLGVVILGMMVYLITASAGKPGPYDAFAQCLTENNVVMYGAFWCPHCANQKKLFGKSFQYVTYVECDPQGKDSQPDLCLQKGVQSYPTWEVNGTIESGEMPLNVLAEKSGCVLQK